MVIYQLSIIVGSWNVSESEIYFAWFANMNMWIPPSKIEPHDIYVIGLQKCAPTSRKQLIVVGMNMCYYQNGKCL